MKPITLKLAGLQSYREPQTIDFTELCETGLFGIFGPTGSGKSTILDAITLALYGKVGRASGGTQGIMNHSEDTLLVAFTFELNSAAGTERYRVERRFKRQGELSVSNTISRFIEIQPEGEKVVADKLADVTRCVEQKLGLKMDDFTRAVVLPQGKFAEFLSLKGADRRAMLQRLFHLEKYGDHLGQKLTRKVRANEQRRGEVAAEQQGLGNASAEALEQAAAVSPQSALAALQTQRAAAEAAMAAANGLLEQAAARSAQHREALAAQRREWAERYPSLTPEEPARQIESFAAKDRLAEDLRGRLAVSVPFIEEKTAKLQALAAELIELDKTLVQWEVQEQGKQEQLREKQERLHALAGERPVDELLAEAREKLTTLRQQAEQSRALQTESAARSHELAKAEALAGQAAASAREQEAEHQARWLQALNASPFEEEPSVLDNLLAPGEGDSIAAKVQSHRSREQELVIGLSELDAKLAGQTVSEEEWQLSESALTAAKEQDEAALQQKARAERDWEDLQVRHVRWQELETVRGQLEREAGLLAKLQSALRGNAFVEYVAEEQLMNVSHAASQRLRFLTKQRYALETDSGGGFVIRDDASGGVKRPVATLSGGETFLASLALALALSAQIQLRGQYPLQFFFLDEGFGTLDPELLDTVITSLEHLHHDHLSVGIISHVAELRSRLARKLVVIPAESGGAGSRIELERL
ncbi:AAA family ATPase [Paenibacillus rubinfantis]|uniref:AAA family ATPase n=1 Tax=Paenibacillus rubinfantis TaxID=1720296 RepID=UPI00073F42D6|nr:AAA family ATPase [Paenibacillus rubinfantis]